MNLPAGWAQFTDAPILLDRTGADAETVALSFRYQRGSTGWADPTIFKGNRSAVWIHLSRHVIRADDHGSVCSRTPIIPNYHSIPRHFVLVRAKEVGHLEGATGSAEYRFWGRVRNEYNLELRIDFARRPTLAQRTTAQRVLDQIRLPNWPLHC